MDSYLNDPEIPMGLGMALAQNVSAMQRFSSLPAAERQAFIANTRTIQSKDEMQAYVRSLLR